jgi:hypothetical protein
MNNKESVMKDLVGSHYTRLAFRFTLVALAGIALCSCVAI